MNLLAQVDPKTFWNAANNSPELLTKIVLALILGVAFAVGLTFLPPQLRKWVIRTVTFFAGLFYVMFWLFPAPIGRKPTDAPRGAIEAVSFWVGDSQSVVASLSNVINGFLIGLGVYSLLRVHMGRVVKQQRDWIYSAILVASLFLMAFFGFYNYYLHTANPKLSDIHNWTFVNYAKDLLFDGLLQNMDAGMFSIVAFYIMSAAYRAFRARSVEATILLVTALIMMLSLMGVVQLLWSSGIDKISPTSPIVQSFKLDAIANWLGQNIQTPAIRGIDFGVGIGLMAMALRLWLSLERTGGES